MKHSQTICTRTLDIASESRKSHRCWFALEVIKEMKYSVAGFSKPLLMLHKGVQCKLKPLLTPQLHKLVTSSLKERSICVVSIHRKTNLRRCPPKQRPLPYIVFFVYCWHANSRISPNCEPWWIRYSSLVKALLKEQGRWIYDLQVYGISAKSHISKICIT